jgi:hypothetical protein
MSALRGFALAAVAIAAAGAGTGCGVGAGPSSEGTATLLVTRDYGSDRILEASEDDPAESETVLRFLDREAEIETRYGGGFVQSIAGLAGGLEGSRSFDWFFYVNGIESSVGSADRPVAGGDRIWWDYHDWTDAMRVPAVVGSFPEPFLQASAGSDRLPVQVVCAAAHAACDQAARRLAAAGADAGVEPLSSQSSRASSSLRLLVGPWGRLRRDPAAAQIEGGPATSGVFAEFEPAADRGWSLVGLDERARVATRFGADAGLVAAVRNGEDPPTWLATGGDAAAVRAAVGLLDERDLTGRYAVARDGGSTVALPELAGEGAGR